MSFVIKCLPILFACLLVGVKSELELTTATDNDGLPNFANYLHRFQNDSLKTRTIASSIQFYAIFNNTEQIENTSAISVAYNASACISDTTYVMLQFGKCNWNLTFALESGNCSALNSDDGQRLVSTSNSSEQVKLSLNYSNCQVGAASNDAYLVDSKRVNVKIQTSRGNTGIELILSKGMYGYPTEKSDTLVFVILCVLFAMTLILIVASMLAVYFNRVFIKSKSVRGPIAVPTENLQNK